MKFSAFKSTMTSTSPPSESILKRTWSGLPTKSNRQMHKSSVYQSSYSSGSSTKTSREKHDQENTKITYTYHPCKCIVIVISLSIQLFLFWVEIYRQKLIFPFLLFRYCILVCPNSFHTPISCTYLCYGLWEPQSQSIWQTHLHFQGYVTNY